MEFIGADATQNHAVRATQLAAGQQELKNEWGADYDKNLKVTQAGFKEFADEGMIGLVKELGIDGDPRVLRFFHKLGMQLGEDKSVKDAAGGAEAEVGDALKQIADIRNDKNHAFHDPNKAGHKEAVARMNQLYGIAYPGAANANL